MSSVFFCSDIHFGHKNILKYCPRPYTSIEEMNEALIKNWNDTVSDNDTVYHLGDWAFHDFECIGRLKGNIFSIPGNHDTERKEKILPFLKNGFSPEVTYLKIDSVYRFVLCHYPFECWHRSYKFHLHGHLHGSKINPVPNRLDVGVDATELYRPISLEELKGLL